MAHRSCLGQLEKVRCELNQAEGLPFSEYLPREMILQALLEVGVVFRDRIYNPVVTLWMFLAQALDANKCCRQAVSRLATWRLARGLSPCSEDTCSYCQARMRLPLTVLMSLVRHTASRLEETSEDAWRWHGRNIKVVDGTTVTMPDTQSNAAAFPKRRLEGREVGFPIARVVVTFSLAIGSVLEATITPTKGKKTGESTMLRQMADTFEAGDIVMADREFESFHNVSLLQRRGVDVVLRMNATRRCDFRRGRRLGKRDHVVIWKKPRFDSTRFDRQTYEGLPEMLEVRELEFTVTTAGFRTKRIRIVTTLLDPDVHTKEEIADLYRQRWQAELNLNSLKTSLDMEHLRCKSPEMVEKEIWVHFLAYNVLRQIMADAAKKRGIAPRQISFSGAQQRFNANVHVMSTLVAAGHQASLAVLYQQMLDSIARDTIGDRPDRIEPRKLKYRQGRYPYLKTDRNTERKKLCA